MPTWAWEYVLQSDTRVLRKRSSVVRLFFSLLQMEALVFPVCLLNRRAAVGCGCWGSTYVEPVRDEEAHRVHCPLRCKLSTHLRISKSLWRSLCVYMCRYPMPVWILCLSVFFTYPLGRHSLSSIYRQVFACTCVVFCFVTISEAPLCMCTRPCSPSLSTFNLAACLYLYRNRTGHSVYLTLFLPFLVTATPVAMPTLSFFSSVCTYTMLSSCCFFSTCFLV